MKFFRIVTLTLLLILIFPEQKFIIYEPFLIWKIDKNLNLCFSFEKQPYIKYYLSRLGKMKKMYYFKDYKLVFFNNKGKIEYILNLQKDDIISTGAGDEKVLIYKKYGNKIREIKKTGELIFEKELSAYPVMSKNENYSIIFTTEGVAFTTLKDNGEMNTNFIFMPSIITSVDSAYLSNLFVIGDINGSIGVYNHRLERIWSRDLKELKIPVIKKVSISPAGDRIAVLAGIKNETLFIFDKNGKIIFKYSTGEDRRRPIDMYFSTDSKFLLEESLEGFRVYSIKKKKLLFNIKLFEKSFNRKMISMDISNDGNFILVAYKFFDSNISIVEFYNRNIMLMRLIFENELPLVKFDYYRNSFLIETSDRIFLYGF